MKSQPKSKFDFKIKATVCRGIVVEAETMQEAIEELEATLQEALDARDDLECIEIVSARAVVEH